jgi:putative transposase
MTRSARGTLHEPGRGVARKRALNRAILDRGWAELERQLQYKGGWYGARIVSVAARDTSITCARCNSVDKESRESQARFHCRHCGHHANADVNAARVILARAQAQLAGGHSVTARGDLQAKQAGSMKREPTRQQAAA